MDGTLPLSQLDALALYASAKRNGAKAMQKISLEALCRSDVVSLSRSKAWQAEKRDVTERIVRLYSDLPGSFRKIR